MGQKNGITSSFGIIDLSIFFKGIALFHWNNGIKKFSSRNNGIMKTCLFLFPLKNRCHCNKPNINACCIIKMEKSISGVKCFQEVVPTKEDFETLIIGSS